MPRYGEKMGLSARFGVLLQNQDPLVRDPSEQARSRHAADAGAYDDGVGVVG